jgi:hypothetical protein
VAHHGPAARTPRKTTLRAAVDGLATASTGGSSAPTQCRDGAEPGVEAIVAELRGLHFVFVQRGTDLEQGVT